MTDDPERLLSSKGAAGAFERELLHGLRELTPPAGARDEGWQSVSRQLTFVGAASLAATTTTTAGAAAAPTATTVAGGGQAVVGASLKLATWKLVVGLGVLGGGVSGAVIALQSPESVSAAQVVASGSSEQRAAVAVNQESTVVASPREQEAPEAKPVESPARENAAIKRRAPTPDAERVDELSLESELLVSARSQLRAGEIGQAQATLLQLNHRLPRGALMQEREVLQIELLAARGDHASASRRARAFVTAHPKSPHSAKLARFVNVP